MNQTSKRIVLHLKTIYLSNNIQRQGDYAVQEFDNQRLPSSLTVCRCSNFTMNHQEAMMLSWL